MKSYTWYLHPSSTPLCLLDSGVTKDVKQEISRKIFHNEDQTENSLNYNKTKISSIIDGTAGNPSLVQFIGPDSKMIFDLIGLDKKDLEWMKIPPDYWKDMDGFIKFRDFANKLPVTNDSAERNVKLVQDFIDTYHTE